MTALGVSVAPTLPLHGVRGGSGRVSQTARKPRLLGVKCNAEPSRLGKGDDELAQVSGDWRQFRYVSRTLHVRGESKSEAHDGI